MSKIKSRFGRDLDFGALVAKNPNTPAAGNASMNARGDKIGRNGEIIKTREAISHEYHATSRTVQQQVALRNLKSEVFQSPAEALASLAAAKTAPAPVAEVEKTPAKKPRKLDDSAE
jgi:hypothetical protein